jgi:hypothetical protein
MQLQCVYMFKFLNLYLRKNCYCKIILVYDHYFLMFMRNVSCFMLYIMRGLLMWC